MLIFDKEFLSQIFDIIINIFGFICIFNGIFLAIKNKTNYLFVEFNDGIMYILLGLILLYLGDFF